MQKSIEKILILATLLTGGMALLDAYLGRHSGLLVCTALTPFLTVAIILSCMTYFDTRLRRLALEEQQDHQLAKKQGGGPSLFSGKPEQDELFDLPFTRNLQQLQLVILPAMAVILVLIEAVAAYRLFNSNDGIGLVAGKGSLAAALMIGQGFILFLLSRYCLGFARDKAHRHLRAVGIMVGLSGLASFVAGLTALLSDWLGGVADRVGSYVLITALCLLAIETLFLLVAAFYSPRRAEMFARSSESRLGSWLTDPAAWAGNLVHAMDYQFGYNLNQNWVLNLLKRLLLPLAALVAVLVYFLSCFVFLGPEEQGIMETMGKPQADGAILESGFYVKKPWPFQTVRRWPAKRVLSIHLGYDSEIDTEIPKVIVWTVPHFSSERPFLVAAPASETGRKSTPVGLLVLNVPVEYRVTDLHRFVYNFYDAEQVVKRIAQQCLTQEIAGRDLMSVLGADRIQVGQQLKTKMQQAMDRQQLGVKIEFVGLQGVHPPAAVADAFEGVVGALEEKEATRLEALAYAAGITPLARAAREAELSKARAYKAERVQAAKADVNYFNQRQAAYKNGPEVYKTAVYLDSLVTALKGSRKYIVDHEGANEVIDLNFQEKLSADLFDFQDEDASKGEPTP